ncbi:MAG: hypothetical protein KGL41_02560 [Actinomycetales bacterium]|nr:hypothetical protein [Actinomycetales bacterium]
MNKNQKRNLIAAAGAATVLSVIFAGPSIASTHSAKAASSSSSSSTGSQTWSKDQQRGPKLAGTFGQLAATVTGVPSTVTDARSASRGAYFTVYTLASTATEAPATAPTTGGVRLEIRGGTLTAGTLAGNIPLLGGANGSTTKVAVYPSTGGAAIFATVTVDANGVATVTSSGSLTATYDAATAAKAPAGRGEGFGNRDGKGGPRDGHGPRDGKGPKGQPGAGFGGVSATVNVPADGKTYSIKITETAEKGVAVTSPEARPALPVTGTGAQTIKLPLGPSDTYKVELIAADGTVAATVTVTINADGTVTTPIVLG